MIARMPELSLSDTSARLKPSRLSISSWLRMRSAPPLAGLQNCAVVDHRRPLRGGLVAAPGAGGRVGAAGAARLLGLERQAPFGGERVLIDLSFVWPWCLAVTGRRFP